MDEVWKSPVVIRVCCQASGLYGDVHIYKTCVRSVSSAVLSPMVGIATQGARVSAMLVSDFSRTCVLNVEHEAEVLAIN